MLASLVRLTPFVPGQLNLKLGPYGFDPPLPPPKAASEAHAEAKERNKGGRPQEHNWDAVKSYALALIREHGLPGPGNRKFPTKEQLVEGIVSKWAFQGMTLAPSSVRKYVNRWLREL